MCIFLKVLISIMLFFQETCDSAFFVNHPNNITKLTIENVSLGLMPYRRYEIINTEDYYLDKNILLKMPDKFRCWNRRT